MENEHFEMIRRCVINMQNNTDKKYMGRNLKPLTFS